MKYPNTSDSDYEVPDNTPVAIPTRLRLPQTRTEQMRAFIRSEMSRMADDQGHETFEEADDLEPDDDEPMPYSAYELHNLEPAVTEPPNPLKDGVKAEGPPPVDPAAKPEGTPPPVQGVDDGS